MNAIERLEELVEAAALTEGLRVRVGFESANHVPLIDHGSGLDAVMVAQTSEMGTGKPWRRAELLVAAASALPALLKLARAAETLRRALPDYDIHGSEVLAEEWALFEALEPLVREVG